MQGGSTHREEESEEDEQTEEDHEERGAHNEHEEEVHEVWFEKSAIICAPVSGSCMSDDGSRIPNR